jgi:hypothetical protein
MLSEGYRKSYEQNQKAVIAGTRRYCSARIGAIGTFIISKSLMTSLLIIDLLVGLACIVSCP